MKTIDTTNVSAHVIVDRQVRIDIIEKAVGWGESFVEAPDRKGRDCTAILTTTGVIAIITNEGMMVTAWVASVKQAVSVYERATGSTKLPKKIWNVVNYNNNTEAWKKMVA